ncbi:hypothetical protein Poli38472_010809 [Pythium oligandrum]|uniref:Phosphoribosyltransferase domain-containing protein n=1 Tax=Pythium oligandrum TaxID=41045 RepID=A0A8K1CE44_PYTOL|nr:hypothetical protein Poli38472_010809 [Pythium oligandrum]|eukprot:TMW61746.1 hypothetical protein Poli38472_010809 [Pythium oligandrum]
MTQYQESHMMYHHNHPSPMFDETEAYRRHYTDGSPHHLLTRHYAHSTLNASPPLSPLSLPRHPDGYTSPVYEQRQPLPTLSTVLNPPSISPRYYDGVAYGSTRSHPRHYLSPSSAYSPAASPGYGPVPPRIQVPQSPWSVGSAEADDKLHHSTDRKHTIVSRTLARRPIESPISSCSSPSSPSSLSVVVGEEESPQDDSESVVTTERKTSRYLREMDRRAILERLARGEKQATLAKEYNVSRAAICNLYKHRHEVMSRTDEDPFAKHPKKRKNKKLLRSRRTRSARFNPLSPHRRAVAAATNNSRHIHHVQSDSVLLLLTVMSDRRSSAAEFRRASERALWLLIEEALSIVPIKLTQLGFDGDEEDGHMMTGVTTEHPPCAITMEQANCPMMEVFQSIDPDRPIGYIHHEASTSSSAQKAHFLSNSRLPTTLKYHNVFLFDVAVVSSDAMCAMIECVKERGALEVMIYIVTLFISSDVVETLHRIYPHIRIVTTQIDAQMLQHPKHRRSCAEVVLSRFDQVYQTQYTLV